MKVDPTLIGYTSNSATDQKNSNVDGKDNKPYQAQIEMSEHANVRPLIVDMQERKNITVDEMN